MVLERKRGRQLPADVAARYVGVLGFWEIGRSVSTRSYSSASWAEEDSDDDDGRLEHTRANRLGACF